MKKKLFLGLIEKEMARYFTQMVENGGIFLQNQ